ncbi:hypothetical protein J4Q44_G00268250 [Coregonus suidteri]|uniref:Uncharacterized protein n=1 Tax=Coregonus suidteri TaxID=861788 RepID=A0AAN8LB16_9TELE
MSEACSEEEWSEEQSKEQLVNRLPVIQIKPRSPGISPNMSPRDSPRGSPRNSPMLFRKLLMNRSISLQRRFTLAYTPRVKSQQSQERREESPIWTVEGTAHSRKHLMGL